MLGDKYDFVLIPRSKVLKYLRETLYNHALEHLEAARLNETMVQFSFLPT